MDKPWKVVFAFVGVFIAGAVFGGFFTLRSTLRRPSPEVVTLPAAVIPVVAPVPGPTKPGLPRVGISAALMRQFAQRLSLTNDQREKVRPIFARWGEDFQHLRQENERQQQQYLGDSVRLSERMFGDVAAILSPEQRVELEKMRRESEERVERERQKRVETNKAAGKAANKAADPLRNLVRPEKDKGKNSPGP
ncbi:MAG: hypothetical protein ABIQ12_04780 [Opitutaceae bacterium]